MIPNGKIHLLYGLLLWVLCWKCLMLFPVLIGSILPDCDHRHAPAGKWFPLWRVGVRHRGITHTAWAIFVVAALSFYFVGSTFAWSISAGYFLHLLLDSMTPAGVSWFGKRKKPRR